jgi:hypothetical protein
VVRRAAYTQDSNDLAGTRTAHPLLSIAAMHKVFAIALSVPLVACFVGNDGEPAGGDDTGDEHDVENPPADSYTHLTASTTWSGIVDVTANTMVDAGVTLTIAPGTVVRFAAGKSIAVNGIVDVQGTKASVVELAPATAGQFHYGFTVGMGGQLTMTYGVQTGGGIRNDGGKVTVTDTRMSRSQGDFLVASAGTIDVSYSSIGLEPGDLDTTHCDAHFSGAGTTVKITHSNISTSAYGLMLYGGTGVDLTYNNWFSNQIQIDTTPGVSADVSYGWFDKGAPVAGPGASLTYSNPAATRLADAGPR